MKRLVLLLLLIPLSSAIAVAQENAAIETIELSGIGEDRLTAALRDDLQKLTGQKFDSRVADQFADRIQGELPEYVVAARTMPGTQQDMLRLIFVAAHISDDDALGANINARYPIDAVEIKGAPRTKVSDALFGDMQKMVGQQLNNEDAEKLRERLAAELGPTYNVFRKVQRSFRQRQLKIIYEVFRIPWLPAREPESFAAYHSSQGFSAAFNVSPGFRGRRAQNVVFGVANDGDTLIERYAGFRVGYENIRLVTDRLGIKFNYASYRNQWSVHTRSPDLYRRRRNLEASVAFAFNPNLYVTTGVSATELELELPTVHFEPSRAAIAAVRYRRRFDTDEGRQTVDAGYEVHTASHSLESNFIYTRHVFDGRYVLARGQQSVGVSGIAGRITGSAPIFERFSLGNTRTLRGWNKFDFAPAGGNRLVYGSFEYHFSGFRVFYDVGSVWDAGNSVKIRPSIGIGFGEQGTDDFFIGIAVPIRESGMRPTFLVVCRFDAG